MDIEMMERKRKSPKFNAFDVVIILVLLLAVIIPIVLAVRADRANGVAGNAETVEYEIRIDNIDVDTISSIKENQNVTDAKTGKVIGKVSKISEPRPYKNYRENEDGTVVISESTGSYIILTISTSAVYNDVEGYTVQGERIAVGKTFDIRLPNFEATGVCVDLNGIVARSN